MQKVFIRDASASDWPAIWLLIKQVSAEGETYIYPRDIDEELAHAIWMEGADSRVSVALDDQGMLLGTAKAGRNYMGPGSHVATGSYMVTATARGKGVGAALAQDSITWARGRGFRTMVFNAVVSTNTVARRLWQRLGFSDVGLIKSAFRLPDGGFADLVVMQKDL
ncbi:MAG: GNAT family N-acetyltransferase [Gammaproteobacteria bacterium]|jgi:L-amino acid N-acyltransferase YncA